MERLSRRLRYLKPDSVFSGKGSGLIQLLLDIVPFSHTPPWLFHKCVCKGVMKGALSEAGCSLPSEAGCSLPSEAGCSLPSEAGCSLPSEAVCSLLSKAGCSNYGWCGKTAVF